jgi:tetratricopeptide (TPR) repeat protein
VTAGGNGVRVELLPLGRVGPLALGMLSRYWLMADKSLAFGGGAFASAPPDQATDPTPTRVSTVRSFTPSMIVTALAAAVTFWAAYDGGTYSLTSRTTFAVGVAWAIVLGLVAGLLPVGRAWRPALVPACLLAGFAAWAALSAAWAVSAEDAFIEFDRVTLFLALFALAALAASRATARRIADGLGIGIALVGLLALAARLFPGLVSQADFKAYLPVAFTRLSYPVDYWNGLAILLALAFPLLLHRATRARSPVLAGAALAPLPALSGAVYLTSSRGGVVIAAFGVLVFFACARERWAVAEAAVLAGLASLLAILVLHARPSVVNPTAAAGVPGGSAHAAAVLIVLLCLATGGVYAARAAFLPELHPPRAAGWACVLGAIGAAVLAVALSHPVRHFEAFKRPPVKLNPGDRDFVQQHLFSANGSGRWQLWNAALKQFESKPAEGRGAGSYEEWWAQKGTIAFFVRDAHSLYLETLGELGIVGFVLLGGALLSAVAIALDGLVRGPPEERSLRAALVATALAFLLACAIDWMWELTVVSIVGFTCLGLLAGLGTGRSAAAPVERRRPRLAVALPVAIVALAVIAGQAIALYAQTRLNASQSAVDRGDTQAALRAARAAHDAEPWAATPYLQLALIEERASALRNAELRVDQAIERDREDWRLWLTRARIQTKRGHIRAARRSLARAHELNPRSPIFAGD